MILIHPFIFDFKYHISASSPPKHHANNNSDFIVVQLSRLPHLITPHSHTSRNMIFIPPFISHFKYHIYTSSPPKYHTNNKYDLIVVQSPHFHHHITPHKSFTQTHFTHHDFNTSIYISLQISYSCIITTEISRQ